MDHVVSGVDSILIPLITQLVRLQLLVPEIMILFPFLAGTIFLLIWHVVVFVGIVIQTQTPSQAPKSGNAWNFLDWNPKQFDSSAVETEQFQKDWRLTQQDAILVVIYTFDLMHRSLVIAPGR